jgi:hypothetical protein
VHKALVRKSDRPDLHEPARRVFAVELAADIDPQYRSLARDSGGRKPTPRVEVRLACSRSARPSTTPPSLRAPVGYQVVLWMVSKARTHRRFSFRVRMNRSAQPLPSGARTKAGELVLERVGQILRSVIVPHGEATPQPAPRR